MLKIRMVITNEHYEFGTNAGYNRDILRIVLFFYHWYPFFVFLLGTGCRIGEAIGIRWDDIVLLFIVYFGATKAMDINIEAETASIIVFVFWGTAEMADLVRGSLISIPKIQYESSESLGLSLGQTYQYVIIPQIIRRMIPLSINLITRMIKTTSLVMMIGIVEVLKVGQQIIEANRKTSPNAAFAIFATILLLYFIACWPISCLSKYLEKRWEN